MRSLVPGDVYFCAVQQKRYYMDIQFERLEMLLSEGRIFLDPSFSLDFLCLHAGADKKDFDIYLMDNFGIDLRRMVMLYVDEYFRQVLGF